MIKLYRFRGDSKEYWETWDNDDGSHTVHWGVLGTEGKTKYVKSSYFKRADKKIQEESSRMMSHGFKEIEFDDHYVLLVEYEIDGHWGAAGDVEKRHRLEDKLNEVLGWTGLGNCDGGSIGSGTMEACNFVVDFELAKKVIEDALVGTEFEDYTRIYEEDR